MLVMEAAKQARLRAQQSAKVPVLLAGTRQSSGAGVGECQSTLLICPQLSFDDFDLCNRVCYCSKLPFGSMSLIWNQMSNCAFLASHAILISGVYLPGASELPQTRSPSYRICASTFIAKSSPESVCKHRIPPPCLLPCPQSFFCLSIYVIITP